MTETVLEHPAEPVENGSTYGGFAEIARRLNALHPERPKPISRQLVHRWFQCRESNGFPATKLVQVDGKWGSLFNLQAVEDWHSRRERGRSGNHPIETIPMFDLDQRGHPIDMEQTARAHPAVREGYRDTVLDL